MPQINAQEEARFLGVTDQRARAKNNNNKNPHILWVKSGAKPD